ncbi:MAG: hypothetical protein KAX49_12855 [Halanaerobiales bacterium]|nr:hypothetical protein [Halanaerobiales bacterium]
MNSSTKFRIIDVEKAAVWAVTVKYSVTDVRVNKKRMSEEVEEEITDDLANWGLKLVNFVLVDFQDTEDSKVISNISRRREVQIESETRIDNANRIKDAESDQLGKDREIERDEAIAMREQSKKIQIAKQEQSVAEEEMKIKRVREVKQQDIEKEQAIIKAQAEKEQQLIAAVAEKEKKRIVAEGYKEQMILEGEGNASKRKAEAEAEAAAIEKRGLAEARVKEELAKSLNMFTVDAIRALTAEQVVEKDKEIGIAMAEALKAADLKFVNAGKATSLLDLIGSAEGGANLGAMFDSFEKVSGSELGEVVSKFFKQKQHGENEENSEKN